jgi:Uma2 family endonuclease
MSTIAKLTGSEFDSMVARGAFEAVSPKKAELIYGELQFMNPAGPVHNDYIDYLMEWSIMHSDCKVRIQSTFNCGDHRPEPDVAWFKPRRYGRVQPTEIDVLLIIEVAESSVRADLDVKRRLYAEHSIPEYWVVDVDESRIHVFNESDRADYRSHRIIVPPTQLAPTCRPETFLNTEELFAVR